MSRRTQPRLEEVDDSILQSPEGSEYGGDIVPAAADAGPRDVAGPSTTYLPPEPRPGSPRLPDLRSRPFPPDLDKLNIGGVSGDGDDDEDDEVVARLPVYVSPALHPSLSLYQFPLQHRSLRVPEWATDRGKRISSRVKEQAGRVDIEIPVDADPKVWREERAKELGFIAESAANGHGHQDEYGLGGQERDKGRKRDKGPKWGDKMRLRSENVPITKAARYYSGIVHDGALHLHPISRVLQFRTALNYVDEFDVRARAEGSRRVDEDDKKKAARKEQQPRALDDPSNDGSGSIKDFRNKMWATQQKEEEDKWVPYEWHEGVEDQRVVDALEAMLVPEDRRGLLECKSRGLDFLDRE